MATENIPENNQPKSNEGITHRKIILVGAGMAGLAAARYLADHGMNDFLVLEGRNRIGGRIYTEISDGMPIDLGASWIHGPDGGNPITDVARDAGAEMFATDDENVIVYDQSGKPISEKLLNEKYDAFDDLLERADDVAAVNKSLQSAILEIAPDALSDPLMQYQLNAFIEFDTGGDADKLCSLLWESDEEFPGKDVFISNGYHLIPEYLAEGIPVYLDHTVRSVDYREDIIYLETNQGIFSAERVLLTLPLGVLKSAAVQFIPELPAPKQLSLQRLARGHVNKVILVFPEAFWDINQQYIGYTGGKKGQYPYFMNFRKFSEWNALMTFAIGEFAREMEEQPDEDIQADIMASLRKIYDEAALAPKKIFISRWTADPFTMGAYTYVPVGATHNDFYEIAKPLYQQLFFAGEHTTAEYRGTVHGAYISGIREAENILQSLLAT